MDMCQNGYLSKYDKKEKRQSKFLSSLQSVILVKLPCVELIYSQQNVKNGSKRRHL